MKTGRRMFLCVLQCAAAHIASRTALAQQPEALWRFEERGTSLGKDSSAQGGNVLSFGAAGGSQLASQGTADGCVGAYLQSDGGNTSINVSATTAGAFPAKPAKGLSVEMLFRLPRLGNFNKAANTTLIRGGSGAGEDGWAVVFDRHSLRFRAAGRCVEASLVGAGVRSVWNLVDGNWHHLACRLDAKTGEQSIWVDGQCPDSFGGWSPANASAAPEQVPSGSGVMTVLPTAFDGAIDEIAVYDVALSNGTIYQHFHTAISLHKPYTFDPVTTPAPTPLPVNGSYNLSDFHPGTLLPTPEGNSSRWGSKLALPIEQFKAFPNPRYQDTPATGPEIGTPQRLFNWMDPRYLSGGAYRFFAPPDQLLNISELAEVRLQEELATTWNYNLNMFRLGNPECTVNDKKGNPLPTPVCKDQALIDLANKNPQWGVDTIFQRAGAKVCSDYANKSTCEKSWRFKNQTLVDSCYLQDSKGAFLTLTGAKVNASNPRDFKVLRPTGSAASAMENGCPDSLFDEEAEGYQTHGEWKKYGGFKGTVNRINNDGENSEIYMIAGLLDPCPFDSDPQMDKDYKKTGIPLLANGKNDWYSFVSRWRTRLSNNLVKKLTASAESPELKGALFSEYEVQGTSIFFGEWNETRYINSPVMNGGKKRYYSTGDIYPWIQQNKKGPTHQECTTRRNVTTCKNITAALEWGTPDWDGINGAWRGLDWLAQMLPSQIATGDVVWSPFVAAGWSEMEELNTRPAQWIGLLKLLAVSGAEYFYTGFFNLHPAFPDPRNWCWQGAAPAYVQAITSHYLDVLYKGELLQGDMPVPRLENCFVIEPNSDPQQWVTRQGMQNCSGPLPTNPFVSYRFWAGSQQVAVMSRALGDKYVVAGTVQPQSNVEPAPFSVNTNVTLPFGTVTLEFRRQGSVYIIEKTDAQSEIPWSVVQLDGWHESSHFAYWSQDFTVQGELHDGHAHVAAQQYATVRTELSAEATHWLDFTACTTFVRVQAGAQVAFTVHPRPLSISVSGEVSSHVDVRRYNVQVRARGAGMDSPDFNIHVRTGELNGALTSNCTIRIGSQPRSKSVWRWHQSTPSDKATALLELPTDRASAVWFFSESAAFDLDAIVLKEVPVGPRVS